MPEKLTPEEVSIAAQAVGCPVADVHASAPIRLYKCPQSQREWKYTGHCGIATVQFDTSINVVYIRVTDLRTKTVVYEQEGYEGFIFEKQSPFFYAFESDDHIAGFCFAEEFDAAAFALKVTGLMNISKQAAMVSAGAKKAPATGSAPKSPTTKAPEHQKSQSGGSSGGGITGLFSGIFKGKNAAPAAATKKPVIGKVKSFKHVAHLGFSATEGFGEIPPEWRKIFNQAGLSDEDLKDKKTAAFVMKTIVAATHDAPPPPPPPPSNTASRPAPPAPPVSRGAPAPPPPPPQVSNLSPSAPAPPPPPPVSSAGSGSQDLMSMIKSTKLKKVTESDIPKVEEMDESQQTDLAKKIAMAMEMRRSHMQDSDDEDDDDWEM